jgi:protein-disulfide isomerase
MRRAVIVSLAAIGLCAPACARGATPVEPSTEVAATQPAPAGAAAVDPIFSVPIDGLPVLGEPNALVTIVEFTDYECDYCRQAEATITQLRSHYGAEVRVIVAEHPMPIHTKARPAALAALAAAAQGHLEGMHGRLFAGQLDEASIQQAAKAEGLTLARFDADRNGEAVAALDHAEQIAKALGVPGTPAFFINGRKLVGALPLADFEQVIDERLAAARQLVAAGVRRDEIYAKTVSGGLPRIVEGC